MNEFEKILNLEIPTSYRCPITSLIMIDPVTCTDGHSYERDAIKKWLSNHSTSPLTNQVLMNKNLIPNHTLRKSIDEFLEKNPAVRSSGEIYEKQDQHQARQKKKPVQPVYSDWDPIKLGDAPELEYEKGHVNPELFEGENGDKGNVYDDNTCNSNTNYQTDNMNMNMNVNNNMHNNNSKSNMKIEVKVVKKINFEKSVEVGLWFQRHGFYRKAHTIFMEIKKYYPSNLYVLSKICDILGLNGEELLKKIMAKEIIVICDQRLMLNKNDLDAKLAKGISYSVLEEYQKCINILNNAIIEKPIPTYTQFAELYYYIGLSYQELYNSEGLFQVAEQLQKFDRDNIVAWRFFANSYIIKGNKSKALSLINDRLTRLRPKYPFFEYIMLSSMNRPNPHQCYSYANQALKINSLNRTALVQLQFGIFQLKDYTKLLEWCLYTLKLYPSCIASWLNYGLALGNLGNTVQAIRVYNQILKIKPDYTLAKINKCKYMIALGQHHQVIHICNRVISEYSTKKMPVHHLALLYINKSCAEVRLGRKSSARLSAQMALKYEPNNQQALQNYRAAGGVGTVTGKNNCTIS